jgi:hypothetical protein
MEFKDLWDLESAMQVLAHDTVDSKLWADAVEWLIHNGPPEIKKILMEASAQATNSSFPELTPSHYDTNGQPCYDVAQLAKSLNISENEVKKILQQKEALLGSQQIMAGLDSNIVH